MNIFNNVAEGWNSILNPNQKTDLASDTINLKDLKSKRTLPWESKAIYRTRMDIKNWNTAIDMTNTYEPKNYFLQLLYKEVIIDALLTSQIENRVNETLASNFSLYNANNEIDEEQTRALREMTAFRSITKAILNSIYYGYSLVELSMRKQLDGTFTLDVEDLPRTNIVPQKGLFYFDYQDDTKTIEYRNIPEYGIYILEFNQDDLGLLNKAVPHVLMKRFAQSCWSELCEIYGIPPRVLKTNTQDPQQLSRAKDMMNDMGAATRLIIDESEKLEFGLGVNTTGDVFKNLIQLCSNEASILISGAIIGQDTVNGSNGKEKAVQTILTKLVNADKRLTEDEWNSKVIPAFVKLGFLKAGTKFKFDPVEDLDELWTRTKDSYPFMNVDPEFVESKFGVKILSAKTDSTGANQTATKLKLDDGFFV